MIKVFNLPWHVAHQYELYKFPFCRFSVLNSNYRVWNETARPLPQNIEWVPYYENGKYDLAILHIDQQCVYRDISKGYSFRDLNEQIKDIPKIVINHGSPIWPEWGTKQEIVLAIKELTKDCAAMIVNSFQAVKEWEGAHHNIIPIIHGLDPAEWRDLPKEPRIVTAVSVMGLDKYYNRHLFYHTRELLEDRGIKIIEFRTDIKFKNWDEYKDYLGRSLIYFDYSLHTPFNRARTEAMLSGCCVVTAKNHDVDKVFANGINGVIIKNNPIHAAAILEELIVNRFRECVKVGQVGKETAKHFFSKEKYQNQWKNLLLKTIAK